jgi:hypothetical protein
MVLVGKFLLLLPLSKAFFYCKSIETYEEIIFFVMFNNEFYGV